MAANVVSGDQKVTGSVGVGGAAPQAIITAGSGAMDTSNKATGSLHLRSGSNPEVKLTGGAEKLGYAQHALEIRMGTLVANQANTYVTYAPRAMTITGISRRFTSKPASAAGTVVTGITGGGNQLLNTSSEDEEVITDDVLTAYSLTGTSADLVLAKGDKIVVTTTSDNADMTAGSDFQIQIYSEDS
jgi:hypothetical protein